MAARIYKPARNAMQQGMADVEVNPVSATAKPGAEKDRDRVLSADELRAIWAATEGKGEHNTIVRLLMLTGQRREEVAAMLLERRLRFVALAPQALQLRVHARFDLALGLHLLALGFIPILARGLQLGLRARVELVPAL